MTGKIKKPRPRYGDRDSQQYIMRSMTMTMRLYNAMHEVALGFAYIFLKVYL